MRNTFDFRLGLLVILLVTNYLVVDVKKACYNE